MRKISSILGTFVMVFILIQFSSCGKKSADSTIYTGSLSVRQKDAYSEVSGRTSTLWPPHTTNVFEWRLGRLVSTNHGTDLGEVDNKGMFLLREVKAYSFTGTLAQLTELEEAYKNAACDAEIPLVFDFAKASTNLEKSVLDDVRVLVAQDSSFKANGFVNKDSLLTMFDERNYSGVVKELPNCTWKQSDWKTAFETSLRKELKKEGKTLADIHTCNNDAFLQVEVIKNYIATGKIELEKGTCTGPHWYYNPTK